MYSLRPENAQIDRYTGPYERWIFSEELGRPFAFPALRKGPATHITALMEGPGMLESTPDLDVRVPPLWSDAPDVTPFAMRNMADGCDAATAQDDVELAKALGALPQTRYRSNMPVDSKTWTTTYNAGALPAGWQRPKSKPACIIGVIDDGIPFMHRAFRDGAGDTRINACWLQAACADTDAAVPFGKEITAADINRWHAEFGSHEINAYRAAGAIDRDLPELDTVLMQHVTHGAHIAGIAAGNDPFVGALEVSEATPLIAVQLPNTIAWDTSGFGKEMMMLSAIEYIFNRARLIAEAFECDEIPLVINFSYGWSANRHDGKSSFEKAVEALITARRVKQPKTELVMPTGNNFAKQMHARFEHADADDGILKVGWHIKPDDRTSSYLEIWLPPDFDPEGWRVSVAAPKGIALDRVIDMPVSGDASLQRGDPRRFVELELKGQNVGQISADKHLGNRWRIMLAMIPTSTHPDQKRRTPVGTWTVSIDTCDASIPDGSYVDVWVQRDDDPIQLGTGGRQSHLVDLKDRPKTADLTPIRGFGCLNGIGTAPSVFRVAGYTQTTHAAADYSGAASIGWDGETPVVGPEQPSACAVSDQGAFRPGLPSIGVLSGSGARIIGTSAASATVTRLIALNFQHGREESAGFTQVTDDPQSTKLEKAKRRARMGNLRAGHVCSVAPKGPPDPVVG